MASEQNLVKGLHSQKGTLNNVLNSHGLVVEKNCH